VGDYVTGHGGFAVSEAGYEETPRLLRDLGYYVHLCGIAHPALRTGCAFRRDVSNYDERKPLDGVAFALGGNGYCGVWIEGIHPKEP
jgi:hypothetical protein